jgi:hypothetical protein
LGLQISDYSIRQEANMARLPSRTPGRVHRVTCVVAASIAFLAALAATYSFAAPPLEAPPVDGARAVQAERQPDRPRSFQEMAAHIDQSLAARWQQEGVKPAPPASDAEFLRRASLDLSGIIPTVHDVRQFLADGSPDKRARLIERLLGRPSHATHLANTWRKVMLPADNNVVQFGGDAGFYGWLRGQFADNAPYDRMVTELLVTSGNAQTPGPALFYTSLQLKPEELAASTSKIFLGVQIQCAQCHNHPFDQWTRKDFWGYAAFFAQLQRPANPQQFAFQVNDTNAGEVKIPETGEVVGPKFLAGAESPDSAERNRRTRLAVWLTSGQNPYFAKAAVNRLWAMMFGRGIVHPVDDMGDHNAASHPQVLDEIARYFVETGFDVRNLLRTLAATKAYQLSSESAADATDRPELFARMAIKTLTAEQLYDCLTEAIRKRETVGQPGQAVGFRGFDQNRQAFLAKFGVASQAAAEYEAGIPQALTMMNGRLVRDATDLSTSDILGVMDAPFFASEAERVETLFLSTLSRLPSAQERGKFVVYVERRAAENQRRKALGDVLWALLNSAEFALNH